MVRYTNNNNLGQVVPQELIGRKIKNWRVSLELEFDDEQSSQSDSPETA